MDEIDPSKYYSTSEARELLGREVTEGTIKKYCREGYVNGDLKIQAKKIGPRQQWHMLGASLRQIRKAWALEA